MNWNDKRKEQKNQEGPNRKIQKLEKQFKELRKTLAQTSNEVHRKKTTKKEKEILQKLERWADQERNRKEELIYGKEKALGKLRYSNIKINCIKIKHTKTHQNRMFQEDQEMFKKKY